MTISKRAFYSRIAFVIITVLAAGILTFSALSESAPLESDDIKPMPVYTVKEYNGFLAVFPYQSDLPTQITEVYVDSLPESDRKKISNGMQIYSEDELQTLLEDYDGF